MGGMHHSQMGSLWHCFNHINGNGTGNDIAGCILHPCLRHPQIKSWQLHEQVPWWGAKSISRCRSLRVERDRYHTLCIYVYIYIHTYQIASCSHIAQTYFSPKRWLNMTFINSPHGSHVGTEFFRAISPCSMRLLIFQRVWHWMQAQAVGDFWRLVLCACLVA